LVFVLMYPFISYFINLVWGADYEKPMRT
jgi:hypothetical protein